MDVRDWVGFKSVSHPWLGLLRFNSGRARLACREKEGRGLGKGKAAWHGSLAQNSPMSFSRQEFASWSCYVAGLHPPGFPSSRF